MVIITKSRLNMYFYRAVNPLYNSRQKNLKSYQNHKIWYQKTPFDFVMGLIL